MPEQPHYAPGGIVALIVIGLLLLVPSGLCSAVLGGGVIYGAITEPRNAGEALSILPMVFLLGGPFIVGGAAMLVVGIRRARSNRRKQGPTP